MKPPRSIFILIWAVLILGACTPFPQEEDSVEVIPYGIYPSESGTYTVVAQKSRYERETYDYVDSLLFIRIDTSGSVLQTRGIALESRPYLERVFHLNNGNIMLYGALDNSYYYYTFSLRELSLEGESVWSMQMPDRTYGVSPALNGDLFLFGWKYIGQDEYLSYSRIDRSGDTLWARTLPKIYNEQIDSGDPTSDNGCLALGSLWFQDRSTDMLAVKVDADGDTLWAVTCGGDRFDRISFSTELDDGSYLLAGELNLYDSTNTDWSLNSGQQVYLVKVSAGGETLWTRAVGISLRESPNALIEAANGDLVLTGTRDESYAYLYDEVTGWVSRLNPSGTERWLKEFPARLPLNLWELPSGEFIFVTKNLSEGYYVSSPDLSVIKLSPSGTVVWDRTLTP